MSAPDVVYVLSADYGHEGPDLRSIHRTAEGAMHASGVDPSDWRPIGDGCYEADDPRRIADGLEIIWETVEP